MEQQEDIGSKGVFYEITYGENTVYLLGSIHIGLPNLYPLHEKVEAAYQNSEYLVVEINSNDIDPMEMMEVMFEIGVYQDGTTIQDHISPDLYEELLGTISELGLNEETVTIFKPWLLADMLESTLLENAGFSLELGIDQYFLSKAEIEKKEILSLETIHDQLNLYSMLLPESQEKALKATIEDQDNTIKQIEELMEMWKHGDIHGLSKLRTIEEDESGDVVDYFYALTDKRDKEMTAKIEDFLKNGQSETFFVVVGALHLVGENSIIDLLKQQGYEVTKVID
ncbi:TraB/GumN family protein [Anaerobacillus alkaliphilus]|nr:TraB/GumN family protein [Anaerobacillus alkaliphilus]